MSRDQPVAAVAVVDLAVAVAAARAAVEVAVLQPFLSFAR